MIPDAVSILNSFIIPFIFIIFVYAFIVAIVRMIDGDR